MLSLLVLFGIIVSFAIYWVYRRRRKSDPTNDPRNMETEEVNMNYIFEIEDSLTKRRPMYVRKIERQQYSPGKF